MLRILFGIFVVLHGLVHLLYFAQALRRVELRPGMAWPDASWAFSRLLGDKTARTLAAVLCVLAAIGFAAGGLGVLLAGAWARPLIVASAALSTAIWVLFWDGKLRDLANQGIVAVLINAALLVAVLVLQWPSPGS